MILRLIEFRVKSAEFRVKENFLTLFGNYFNKILFEICEKSYRNSALCILHFLVDNEEIICYNIIIDIIRKDCKINDPV